MVAASKMRKAQQAAIRAAVRPLLYRIQRQATTQRDGLHASAAGSAEVRKRAVILVAADKGLCGALNSNVFRLAGEFDPTSTVFITAGRKAAQFVAAPGGSWSAEFAYGDTPRFAELGPSRPWPATCSSRARSTRSRSSRRASSTPRRKSVDAQFLPVGEIKGVHSPALIQEAGRRRHQRILFEPSPEACSAICCRGGSNLRLLALLNAKASEQSARMVSMKNATEDAEEMIEDLKLEYNGCGRATSPRNCWRSRAVRRSDAK